MSSDAVSRSVTCQPHTITKSIEAGEPQHDGVLEDSGKLQGSCRLDKWTISWKDAIRREHEYRNKVKMAPGASGISESPFPESQGMWSSYNNTTRRTLQVDDQLGFLQKLKGDIPQNGSSSPSSKNLTHKKRRLQQPQSSDSSLVIESPMPRQTTMLQTPQQSSEVSMLRQMPILQIQQQSSQVGQIPMMWKMSVPQTPNSIRQNYWCHVCKINCVTEFNFLLHLHGQKHRMNMSKVNSRKSLVEKGFVWCKECNIPSTNLNALAQHRTGKKHLARIEMLAKYRAQGAAAMLPNINTDNMYPEPENQEMRTSNWSN